MKRGFKEVWSMMTCKLFHSKKSSHRKAAEMHENMTEKQIDKMIKDSFPSSDPPSTY